MHKYKEKTHKYKESIKKYWYCFVLGPLFMMLEAAGEFILPYISADMIDHGAAKGDVSYVLSRGGMMLVLAALMLITGVLGAFFSIRAATRLAASVRLQTFKKIQTFSFENIDDFSTGSLITRITNDITQIQNFAQSLLRGSFRSPIMLVGAIFMSFKLNAKLAWIICAVVPVLAFTIATIIRIASPRYTKMQGQLDTLNNNINESITNVQVIKSFVREDYEKEKFGDVNDTLMQKSIKALKLMMLVQPASVTAINFTTLMVVWVAGKQVMIGGMEVGTLSALITYLTQILMSLDFLANIFLQGTRAAASNRRIDAVLQAEVSLHDKDATCRDFVIEQGEVAFKDVAFRYFKHNKEWVLDHVNLHIKPGQMVGVIGPTGCGKTTLVSLISRLYDADEGAVLIDGVDVRDLSLYELREKVSVVLQKNTLFSGTIAENLMWGKADATLKEMDFACEIAQAKEFILAKESGYETKLEQGGTNLSGGQRQRLCIARALMKSPKILILDDSTSAVDTATDAKIRRAFREHLQGVTKIIIAQRINSVMDADQIIVMDEGKIVGAGTHKELLATCQTYQEIYYSQKDKEDNEDGNA